LAAPIVPWPSLLVAAGAAVIAAVAVALGPAVRISRASISRLLRSE
ncbi:MAG: hypothetical protein JWM89_1428, partial [Acidimicrobiales bacterium]|nr:hypothetical protein [Acidimicrobiales bacterium]